MPKGYDKKTGLPLTPPRGILFKKGHTINLGRKFTEEHKRKIGEGHKNIPNPYKGIIKKERIKKICLICKKEFYVRECWAKRGTGKYCSYICSKMGRNKGKTKGRQLIMSTPQYKEWRFKVFIRDGFTCIVCGQLRGKIEAHHIKSFAKYPELRFDINNGITLCEDCHKQVHRSLKNRKEK